MALRFVMLAASRLRASITERLYQSAGIDLTRPAFIRCAPTDRCNYRCQYCTHWNRSEYAPEMTLDEWREALRSLKRFVGNPAVQFTGGEPFVWTPFLDLVEFCHREGIAWGVITNGSAITRNTAPRIVAARPLNIDISIDGANSSTHDTARGVPGSFERLSGAISLLIKEQQRAGVRFPIRLKPTIHRGNHRELVDLVRWTKAIGATAVDFSPFREWLPGQKETHWIRAGEELDTLEQQIDEVIAMKRAGAPVETSEEKLRGIVSHFRGEEVRHGAAGCRSATRNYLIRPNGEVFVCDCFAAIGNVKSAGAEEMWKSMAAREARKRSLSCVTYTSQGHATSCLHHRSLFQEVQRFFRLYVLRA